MRVAGLLVHQGTLRKRIRKEGMAPLLSRQNRHVQRMSLRRYEREVVTLCMIVGESNIQSARTAVSGPSHLRPKPSSEWHKLVRVAF